MSVKGAFIRAGVPSSIASREAPLAQAAMREFGITSQARASAFLAQVLHESGELKWFEELASGAEYEGRRDLGNTHPGDGRRYKGRGPIQLTGRANYRWAGQKLHLDLEGHPELASQHKVGWRIAGLYWKERGLNALADRHDFRQITERINGGLNGYASRLHYLALVQRVDCRPVNPWAGFHKDEVSWIKEWDSKKGKKLTAKQKRRQKWLKSQMVKRRKSLYINGQKSGWNKYHRKARYKALLDRTR